MKVISLFRKFESFAKTNLKWIGYLLVIIYTAYSIANVVIKNDNLTSYLLGFVYTIGLILTIIYFKKDQIKESKFFDLNILFVIFGTFVTYEISSFGVSIVVSSAFVGLLGYFAFKKYSFAIYTGSFAGMSSHLLFNRLEMLLVAIIAALVYQIVKTVFNGYGGRLGTIAFISTSFAGFVFNKESLISHQSYESWIIFLFSIAGVLTTWVLHNKFKQSPVLASALPGLVIGLLFGQLFQSYKIYSFIFFTATFVGMANNYVVRNVYESLFIGLILGFIFLSFFIFFNGFGGKMGLMAFISIIIGKTLLFLFDRTKEQIRKVTRNTI